MTATKTKRAMPPVKTEIILREIAEGSQDAALNQIALAVQRRRKRLHMLMRQERESPVIGEFGRTVQEHPGLTATELGALVGVTPARIYQVAKLAEKRGYIKPVDRASHPHRFWPKDS